MVSTVIVVVVVVRIVVVVIVVVAAAVDAAATATATATAAAAIGATFCIKIKSTFAYFAALPSPIVEAVALVIIVASTKIRFIGPSESPARYCVSIWIEAEVNAFMILVYR